MLEFTHLPIQDGTSIGILSNLDDSSRLHLIQSLNDRVQGGQHIRVGNLPSSIKELLDPSITLHLVRVVRDDVSPNGPFPTSGILHVILHGIDEKDPRLESFKKECDKLQHPWYSSTS